MVLLIDDDVVRSGVARGAAPVVNIDDKAAALDEEDNEQNRVAAILRSMKSVIGEYSNYATAFHNKCPKSEEKRAEYDQYTEVVSVLTGASIDYAKTGVLYLMPRYIAKYGRPLPYFMRYASGYYKRQALSKSRSNMNRLCWDLERWGKQFRWRRSYPDFDHRIMVDGSLAEDPGAYASVEAIYIQFCREAKELRRRLAAAPGNAAAAWEAFYGKHRKACVAACPDQKALANIAVRLCYEAYPNRNKKFLWRVAGGGVLANLKQAPVFLPVRDDSGPHVYLGKGYRMERFGNCADGGVR